MDDVFSARKWDPAAAEKMLRDVSMLLNGNQVFDSRLCFSFHKNYVVELLVFYIRLSGQVHQEFHSPRAPWKGVM